MKYFLILLLSTTICFAQEINKFDDNGKKNGTWKGVYEESKRPRYEGVFDHGTEVGVFKFFDDTKVGTVIATREFNPTDNSCYTIFYNQNKNKVSEGKVVNKKFEGSWKYYHEDSSEIMTTENYIDGKLEGVDQFGHRQPVHVCAQCDAGTGLAALEGGDDAGRSHADTHVVKAKTSQMRRDDACCANFLVAQFGVGMEIAAPGNDLLLERGGARFNLRNQSVFYRGVHHALPH